MRDEGGSRGRAGRWSESLRGATKESTPASSRQRGAAGRAWGTHNPVASRQWGGSEGSPWLPGVWPGRVGGTEGPKRSGFRGGDEFAVAMLSVASVWGSSGAARCAAGCGDQAQAPQIPETTLPPTPTKAELQCCQQKGPPEALQYDGVGQRCLSHASQPWEPPQSPAPLRPQALPEPRHPGWLPLLSFSLPHPPGPLSAGQPGSGREPGWRGGPWLQEAGAG